MHGLNRYSLTRLLICIDYLLEKNWLATIRNPGKIRVGNYLIPILVIVTVEGHSQIEEEQKITDSSKVFVAMWFDEFTKESYENGIKPAIIDAGYYPFRIDQKEHINKIEDEIIAEIRRSKFLIADFTQEGNDARGSVYYEAGFAHGNGLPVIFSCHKDSLKNLHFDTSHYNHIEWTTSQELREKLKNRILAVIGPGPKTY